MNKLVSRSLQILGETAKDIGKDYTSNLTSLINDAQNVKNSIIKSSTDVSDVYAKLKNTNITKKISDWFYDRESEADSSASDEFDAGFKIETSDDQKLDGESKPKALNADSMSDITNKQTNMMIKIGRRQTEQSVTNTAEIVSALNSRTSEMIASMNNVNKSLMGISDRLDKLIQLSTIDSSNSPKEIDKGGLFSDGKLTLSGIFEASKQALSQNSVVSMGSSLLSALQAGQFGPEALLRSVLEMTVLDKKSNLLGGKSINDIGKGFNDMIGTITQTALSEIMGSKYLKDVIRFQGDTDYGSIVQNHYDTKRAQFDGMTRMSIISVIPEYLNKINESLSGKTYHIDNSGKLIEGPATNKFAQVADNAFASSGLSSNVFGKIEASARKVVGPNKTVPAEDITAAGKALTMSIVWNMHYSGTRLFRQSDLKGDMLPYIQGAVQALCRGKNDPKYWASICQTIIIQLSSGLMDSAQFVQNINQSLQNMITQATEFAQSGDPSASQASRITFDMMIDRFQKETFPGSTSKTTSNTNSQTTTSNTNTATIVDGAIGNKNADSRGKYSSYDYIRGIFGILNRGINVKTINKPKNTKGFSNYSLDRQSTDQIKEDDKFGEMMMGVITNSSGDDAKDLSSLITQGIKDATTTVLGEEGANAASQAMGSGGGLSGFFGNMIGNLGASGMNKMFSRAINGTLSKDIKAFFDKDGKGQKLVNDVKSNLSATKKKVMDSIPGSVIYDKRFQDISDAVVGEDGIVQNIGGGIKNKASQIWDKINANEKFSGFRDKTRHAVNNRLYRHDTNSVRRAEENLSNINVDDEVDSTSVEIVRSYIKRGDYDSAIKATSSINNKKLREALSRNVKTIADVNAKRQAGETALAIGETPDIGAVFDDSQIGSFSDNKKGGILSVVKKGFGMVGKVLKQIAKLTGKGVMNITLGLKSMTEGLFGSKQRDANGNVVRNSGLIRNLTTDLYKATKSAIGNMPIAREGGMTVNEGIGKVKQGVKNSVKNIGTTIWRGREVGQSFTRDENGQLHSESVRSGGLSQMQITRSSDARVEDLIKAPAETLKKVMSDVGSSFKTFAEKHMPTFVKVFNWASKKIKKTADENGEKKGLLGRAGDAFRKTAFGSGFMSGFDNAKKVKDKLAKEKERHSSFGNEALGNIMDVIMGKSDGKSAFTQICDLITGLRDDMNNNHKEDLGVQEEENKKNQTTGTSENAQDALKAAADKSSATSSDASGGKAVKGFKSIGKEIVGNIGKMMGGFTQALLGIGQLVVSIVASLEGLQALKDMVMSILTDGLQPLNAVFESVMELIKPIVDIMKGAVTTIADTIVTIAESLISAIQPLIETITPIIETLLDVLNPILDLFKVVADVIMVPLLIIVKAMQPVVEHIGNTLTVLSGFLQVGMGAIITVLGGILTAVGWIVSKFSGNDDLLDSGKDMVQQGAGMVVSGGKQIVQGVANEANLLKRMLPGGEPLFKSDEDVKSTTTSTVNTDNVNLNSGAMGSGDVDNRIITQNSYVYNNTYGSGNRTTMNQHTYGSYMNMSERGCGPVALADAYSRRTGNRISPAALASRMAGSGAYEPNRGTSVGSFINTGNALGMNMRVGGVTMSSLKRATPTNPITLLGSGSDYGTRTGNDHYVNVIGTDRYGFAYVANPLTGRVDRRSSSTLALNSRLGLYGSGDSSDFYSFDEGTTDAMTNLKNLTSRLTGMFTGESTSDSIKNKINEGDEENQLNEIKRQLGEDYKAKEDEAFEAFKKANPKRIGESDEEYEHRISLLWSKPSVYRKYMIDFAGQAAGEKMNEMYDELKGSLSYYTDENSGLREFINKIKDTSSPNASGDGTGILSSTSGAQLYNFDGLTHVKTNITSDTSGESPLHDFFGAMTNSSTFSSNGNWYKKENYPNSEGVGNSGRNHSGVDFVWPNKTSEGQELHATTGGTVIRSDFGESTGFNVKWRDSGGFYHWYMHMLGEPMVKVGDIIDGGTLLGYVGNTGDSDGAHLHYTIQEKEGINSGDGAINPLTYFSVYNSGANDASEGHVEMSDELMRRSAWGSYKNNPGVPMFIEAGRAAGLSPSQIATIISTGIWEDSGKKIFGLKSLTDTTFDVNGQAAKGIMNWVDGDVDYGDTVTEQLGYIRRTYFDPNSADSRSRVRDNEFNEQDEQAFIEATGRSGFKLNIGDRYGPYMNEDITEGSAQFFRSALIPWKIHTAAGMAENVGTAVEVYNWLLDNGYVGELKSPTGKGSTLTGYGMASSAGQGEMLKNVNQIGTTSGKNTGTVVTQTTDLNLRSETNTSTSSSILAKIPNGTKLDLEVSGTKGWFKTTYNGKTGYVSADYINLDENWLDDGYQSNSTSNWFNDTSSNNTNISSGIYDPNNVSTVQTYDQWKAANSSNSSTKQLSNGAVNADKYAANHRALTDPSSAKYSETYTKYWGNSTLNDSSSLTGSDPRYWKYLCQYSSTDPNIKEELDAQKEAMHVALYGSGDVGSDFWYSSLFNDGTQFSQDIPPLDESKLPTYGDTSFMPYGNIINKYEIKTDDSDRIDLLKKMNSMTFNVRAQRVEELLEELIEKVSGDKPKPSSDNSGTDPNLFKDNGIPEQVTRLSRG